jgi:hypothetical protein
MYPTAACSDRAYHVSHTLSLTNLFQYPLSLSFRVCGLSERCCFSNHGSESLSASSFLDVSPVVTRVDVVIVSGQLLPKGTSGAMLTSGCGECSC